MLAFLAVWISLSALGLAVGMAVYRPLFTDIAIVAVLYFGSPGAMCLAGLVLWAHRKENSADPGRANQRLQSKVAMGLSLVAAAIVYWLIIASQKIEPN